MNIAHWLARRAAVSPDRPALFLGQDCVADYATFDARARALAGWFRNSGVAPGDRVAIFMTNTPEYLIVLYAIWYAGAVAVPINAKLHGREAAFVLADADVSAVFVSPDLDPALDAALEGGRAVDASAVRRIVTPGAAFDDALRADPVTQVAIRAPDDMAWLFYTSGTTGRPKGVMITHGMLMSMALCYVSDVDVVCAADATVYAAPMSHGAGLYALMHVQAGAAHVCPASGGFDPGEVLDLAAHFGSVHLFAAPTMVKRMTDHALQAGRDGTGLRTVVYAGGPMYNADIIEAVEVFGPVFVQIYGQGECPMGITALARDRVADREHPRWRARLGSVGRAQSAVEVRIADAQGAPLRDGEAGEILVRGATVMPGYWRNAAATAQALQDGWLRTGDIGSIDAAGFVTLQDRSKDVIITGGSNVYPREVKEVLLLHVQLSEVSVVGRPHPEWGEEVTAFIVGDAAEAELDALCLAHIARFKRPKHYIRVAALPKNNYGKVVKTELRKRLAQEDGSS